MMIKAPCQHEFVMFVTTFFFVFVSYDFPISWRVCVKHYVCVLSGIPSSFGLFLFL